MARHSLTEARRSVMDLRASVLEGQDLAAALQSGTRLWTAGSGVEVDVDVSGAGAQLPQDFEQHLLRIAQEAVANTLKHAGATPHPDPAAPGGPQALLAHQRQRARVRPGGRVRDVGGHFGLIGMRERAERLGGELRLASQPGEGTEVEVRVPLP